MKLLNIKNIFMYFFFFFYLNDMGLFFQVHGGLIEKEQPISGVLITVFCDSDDNRWLSFLKWLLVLRKKIGNLEDTVESESDVLYCFKLNMQYYWSGIVNNIMWFLHIIIEMNLLYFLL